MRSLPFDQFPFELLKMILIRATGHLFFTINRKAPARAEIHTLVTMTAVSLKWWKALSCRKYIRRLLRRYFKRVRHPNECRPQQLTCLHTEGGKDAWDVAVLNEELYVA